MLFGFFQSLEEAHDRQHKCGGFYQLTSGLEKKFVWPLIFWEFPPVNNLAS